jgi:hypothetical protein
VIVGECDDDQFIRREGAKRVLDRLHRVGVTDPRLNTTGACARPRSVPLAASAAPNVI